MKETKADYFYKTLKDNPKEIIAFAKREIKEYQRLIKLIKNETKE